ncbi:acetylglutamate kinase [Agrococcus versicolor]|uniref:Acetylglutamate kinase n=1 Tax=Agrococcus versicolor TaxID=501482 RepID=A0ABP5MJE5_9MICO
MTTSSAPSATPAAKAATLVESLPWLQRFRGATMVIKYGGNAMVNEELQRSFAQDVVYLHHVGIKPVVVHGGGPQISAELARHGIESEFAGGYRVTSAEAMKVVRMVLTGEVSQTLVSLVNEHGPHAVSLSGESAGLFQAVRRGVVVDGVEIDLGHVGDIVEVEPRAVQRLLDDGVIPVVSSVAPDRDRPGESLNVNADAAAAALAVALRAEKLVVLTDVAGLYRDWPDTDSLVSSIDVDELRTLLPGLASGMIPKMQACVDAVEGGVAKAAIVDGREPHAVLLEIFTDSGSGTEVHANTEGIA